jgi:hypothetical protein
VEQQEILEAALVRLGDDRRALLALLRDRGAIDLDWYLREKIVRPRDDGEVSDHARALKYAFTFVQHGATVAFLREANSRQPDLRVQVEDLSFYVEIRKFRSQLNSSTNPVSKVVDAVVAKKTQLPKGQLGFIAIDSFDHFGIESEGFGFTHDHIFDALSEIERIANESPQDWYFLGGLLFAASTNGGTSTPSIPHFIWINRISEPSVPARLVEWLSESLPDGQLVELSDDPWALRFTTPR